MTPTVIRTTLTLCAASVLAGCEPSLPPPPPGSKLTAETIATRDAPPEHQFKGVLAGKPIHLLAHNCKVYRVDDAGGGNVSWSLVLEGDLYPLPTSCLSQSLTAEKGGVTAFIGRQALGAGGCCVGTPRHRTSDGVNWKPN
ncbi:hypothetical protein [Achromobacter arsenitoxydans]|uniref:Lipoprotein 1 n=1 Tax=Achromobacter arsenitoxydans SY8 TaxID=477184 RepID=H0F030_9BURK|nr:hypothetical protein [Achromobacter arsenitoxydans]EHK68446.1 lipoprotein 1 [Achromobacter arsenitoxydans SY8]